MPIVRTARSFKSHEALADFLEHLWERSAREAMVRAGDFTVALAGGLTPLPFYRRLAARPDLPWDNTDIFLTDERCVPYEHPASNYRAVREAFQRGPENNGPEIHRVPMEPPEPEAAAAGYEETLRLFFLLPPGQRPQFDLVLLGLGKDGHTASLFPGGPELKVEDRLAVPVQNPTAPYSRVSLALPVLNNARTMVVLATGREKAPAAHLAVEAGDPQLPGSLVHPASGPVLFLLDTEAASLLSNTP